MANFIFIKWLGYLCLRATDGVFNVASIMMFIIIVVVIYLTFVVAVLFAILSRVRLGEYLSS